MKIHFIHKDDISCISGTHPCWRFRPHTARHYSYHSFQGRQFLVVDFRGEIGPLYFIPLLHTNQAAHKKRLTLLHLPSYNLHLSKHSTYCFLLSSVTFWTPSCNITCTVGSFQSETMVESNVSSDFTITFTVSNPDWRGIIVGRYKQTLCMYV